MGFTLAARLRLGNDSPRLVSVFSGDLTVRCPGLCRTEDLRAVACVVHRITVSNVQPGPIDTDLNPASGDRAVRNRPSGRSTVSGALTTSRAGGVISWPRLLLQYRGEFDRGRRNERLKQASAHPST
jgi:hypothetical protein